MKGIYLTEKAKQEIQVKIAELEIKRDEAAKDDDEVYANSCIGQIFTYYEILSSATVLHVEESWLNALHKGGKLMVEHIKETDGKPTKSPLELGFPQGVIIQPKQ
jgi:hypothetical protein